MQHNDVLNGVLILLRRSLLQYAAEAWPWTGSGSGEPQAAIDRLIAAQAERVYLSLTFVLPHLVENERRIVREIDLALPACAGDPEATALVAAILAEESQTLAELKRLAGPTPSATTQSAA
jgi:hypothetical protein